VLNNNGKDSEAALIERKTDGRQRHVRAYQAAVRERARAATAGDTTATVGVTSPSFR